MSNGHLVPKAIGRFVNIYRPQPDVYRLDTAQSSDGDIVYVSGRTYQDWRVNDHTFIQGPDRLWHCFGITRPWIPGDNGHAGEGLCFHAVSASESLDDAMRFQSWRDEPKIQVGDCGWAPTILRIDDHYVIVGSHLGWARSQDLYAWEDCGRLNVRGGDRDPYLFRWNNAYLLYRCDGNGVTVSSSVDFKVWTDPVLVFRPGCPSHQTESPCVVHHAGRFYLFWTLWDTDEKTTSGYCPRTFVHCSDSPIDFRGQPVIAEFMVHAPEVLQSESGRWYLSSADYPHTGISAIQLDWR